MYKIEKLYTNTNSMTVSEAESYYGKLRIVINIFEHWWGLVYNRAKSPKAIYDYMVKANKSVDYIIGWDDAQGKVRIIAMTPPNRVALTQQGGNPTGKSIEVDPLITTNDPRAYELYKALGWLHTVVETEVGRGYLPPKLHKEVWPTACSDIDKARVTRERNKWVAGDYDPVKPQPPVQGANIEYTTYKTPKMFIANTNIQLWNFNHTKHADMEGILKVPLIAGTPITIVGYAVNKSVGGSKYMMTEYSMGLPFKGAPNKTTGFNIVDLDEEIKPMPVPPPPMPPPVPVPPVDSSPTQPPESEPTPEPKPPKNPPTEGILEAIRIAILGAISYSITLAVDWLTLQLGGFTVIPEDLRLEITGVILLAARYLDKYVYTKLKNGEHVIKLLRFFKLPF